MGQKSIFSHYFGLLMSKMWLFFAYLKLKKLTKQLMETEILVIFGWKLAFGIIEWSI